MGAVSPSEMGLQTVPGHGEHPCLERTLGIGGPVLDQFVKNILGQVFAQHGIPAHFVQKMIDVPMVPIKEDLELIEIAPGHSLHDEFIGLRFQTLF